MRCANLAPESNDAIYKGCAVQSRLLVSIAIVCMIFHQQLQQGNDAFAMNLLLAIIKFKSAKKFFAVCKRVVYLKKKIYCFMRKNQVNKVMTAIAAIIIIVVVIIIPALHGGGVTV
jgi:hypothetical protein